MLPYSEQIANIGGRLTDSILAAQRAHHEADPAALLLNGTIARNRYGEHLAVRLWHATPEACAPDAGAVRLLLPRGHRRQALAKPAACERIAQICADPSRWLFLDTETTGLAGSNTYAFLVGLAWWDSGGLQVEQLFMRDPTEEHSVLLEIARRIRARPVLVTFNGKAFDWPLLETRFRMTRIIDVPQLAAHLDMLHPARELWRLEFGSVRLAELERCVLGGDTLGWSRRDDMDSSLIPEIYFNYLYGGPAEPLALVFRHNAMDLRGLAALAGRVCRVLGQTESSGSRAQSSLELYGVSRLFSRRGQRVRARSFCERALAAGLPPEIDRAARHELARLAQRERDFAYAAALWTELASASAPSLEACEQLAIHYERRTGEIKKAARISRVALANLSRAERAGRVEAKEHTHWQARFDRRLARLRRKAAVRRGGDQGRRAALKGPLNSFQDQLPAKASPSKRPVTSSVPPRSASGG
jgi:uncharacterized protein YprB with RNaseH-like and TPR domain